MGAGAFSAGTEGAAAAVLHGSDVRAARGLVVRLLLAAALLELPAVADAQVRGGPLFFESSYGYADRVGLELGHGGELDGVSVLAVGADHFGVGRRRRVSVSAAAGFWDPAGAGARFTGAIGAQVRLDGRAGMTRATWPPTSPPAWR
jgi:hypothetical protein